MKTRSSESPRGNLLVLGLLLAAGLVLTTVYFREGPSGPLRSARRAVLAVSAPVSAAGEWLTTPLRATGRWVGGFSVSRGDVEAVRMQNARLRVRVAELEEARQENERLRGLVGFAQANKLKSVGGRIIGRRAAAWEGLLTIDKGTAEGVKVLMPVIAEQGLLGQIVKTSAHASQVRLITDQQSGVACLVQRTRATGIVRGSVNGRLTLDFLERSAAPRKGDVVLTSGFGGVYPKGLLVGEVVAVDLKPGDLYPHVVVSSAVPFSGIEEVLVLTSPVPSAPADPDE